MRWEYKYWYLYQRGPAGYYEGPTLSSEQIEERLNGFGQDRWQCIFTDGNLFVFIRPSVWLDTRTFEVNPKSPA